MRATLPIVKINGKHYYKDARLRVYRNVRDFLDTISFDDAVALKVEPVAVASPVKASSKFQ